MVVGEKECRDGEYIEEYSINGLSNECVGS